MADIYPGIIDILDRIKAAKIPLGIYTGKGRISSEITLNEIGVIDYFDLIVTGDDIPEPKPSPLGIKLFIDKYNLSAQKVIMIGDSPADIKAAKMAGVKSISVIWDSYAADEVLNLEQDYLFYTVAELNDFILTVF
jgi:pyrophosphatase PpaX